MHSSASAANGESRIRGWGIVPLGRLGQTRTKIRGKGVSPTESIPSDHSSRRYLTNWTTAALVISLLQSSMAKRYWYGAAVAAKLVRSDRFRGPDLRKGNPSMRPATVPWLQLYGRR